jgi:hypothetical protein
MSSFAEPVFQRRVQQTREINYAVNCQFKLGNFKIEYDFKIELRAFLLKHAFCCVEEYCAQSFVFM